MKKLVLFALILCVPFLAFSQKKKQKQANQDTENWRYEIESVEVGLQGTVVVKVWSYSSKPAIASSQARKNAVHGVVFKGLAAKDRIPAKKPLVPDLDAQDKYADFFDSFFADNGDFMRFVTLTNNGAVEAGDVMKVDKKTYKVGIVVTVNYGELRKALEEKGIVKKLSAGF